MVEGLVAYLVVSKGEQLLAEAVVPLLAPLVRQELDNLVTALEEMVSVPPDRVGCISELDLVRVPMPSVRC